MNNKPPRTMQFLITTDSPHRGHGRASTLKPGSKGIRVPSKENPIVIWVEVPPVPLTDFANGHCPQTHVFRVAEPTFEDLGIIRDGNIVICTCAGHLIE